MIRIDAVWLAVQPLDMRAGTETALARDVTLNYNNMGSVAKYDTVMSLTSAVTGGNLSTPVGFTPKYDGRGTDPNSNQFDRYYTYDAQSDTLTAFGPLDVGCGIGTGTGKIWSPSSGHGGVFVANGAGDAAIGVAGKTTVASGKVQSFGRSNCLSTDNTSTWSAFTGHVNWPAGTSTVTTFVIADTVANIKSKMRQLYLQGAI